MGMVEFHYLLNAPTLYSYAILFNLYIQVLSNYIVRNCLYTLLSHGLRVCNKRLYMVYSFKKILSENANFRRKKC